MPNPIFKDVYQIVHIFRIQLRIIMVRAYFEFHHSHSNDSGQLPLLGVGRGTLLDAGLDYHDPCCEAATALRRPFFRLPCDILLAEDSVHCLRHQYVCNLVSIDELLR